MDGNQARELTQALINAGILSRAVQSPIPPPYQPQARRHEGGAAIWGIWSTSRGAPERPAIIGCAHVAEALVAAGKWTVEAIRACHHTPPGQDPDGAGGQYPFKGTLRKHQQGEQ